MVMIGIDAHKKTFTAVVVSEVGRELGHRTFKSTSDGCFALVRWASRWPDRRFAVEDCRHLTRRLESDLLAAGESLVRVHTQLMASERRGGRERGKSDPIDALAVARVALREPDLPVARLDGPTREIRLLTDHRQCLVRERTRLHNRLRWHLHELNPEFDVRPRGLRADKQLKRVACELDRMDGLVAELALDLVERCSDLNQRIRDLEARLRPLVHTYGPSLLALPGCGLLSAAKILGETAGVDRFRSSAAYAKFNGTAPVPVWSSNTERFRLNRGGNRQINYALHMIAITQLRGIGQGKAYVAKRVASGNSKTEAIRLLRRCISDSVYRALRKDLAVAVSATEQDLLMAA
jgi:transposase